MRAFKILSWDWFQLKNEMVCPMLKVHPTFELTEILLRNNNKVRIAITGCDARYVGVYYATAEYPSYNDPSAPIVYLVLNYAWQGYPLNTGSFAVLGEDTFVPTHIQQFQSKVDQACATCGPYLTHSNKPNHCNLFNPKDGLSSKTVYSNICNECTK